MKEVKRPQRTVEVGVLGNQSPPSLVVYDSCSQPTESKEFVALYVVAEGRMVYSHLAEIRASLRDPSEFRDTDLEDAVDKYFEYAKLGTRSQWLDSQRKDAGLRLPVASYATLRSRDTRHALTYEDLLSTEEWLERRWLVLHRDGFCCTKCKASSTGELSVCLQVHHKYYVRDWMPWEYPDEALVTLCLDCHSALHRNGHVPVFDEKEGKLVATRYRPCIRCLGAGFFPQYMHVQMGVCFRCGGARFELKMQFVRASGSN